MTVKDLADRLEVKVKDVLKKVLEKGKMMTINSTLDADLALMIAREFGADVQMRSFEEDVLEVESESSRPEDLVARAPVASGFTWATPPTRIRSTTRRPAAPATGRSPS